MPGSLLTDTLIVAGIIWLIIFIVCLISVSWRKDISLPEKLFWAVVIFFAPVIGLIFYLIFGFRNRRIDAPASREK